MIRYLDLLFDVANLDVRASQKVKLAPLAILPATVMVLLASISAALCLLGLDSVDTLVLGAAWGIIFWLIWTAMMFLLVKSWLAEPGTSCSYFQFLRCIGFSLAPGVLWLAGILPYVGWIFATIATFWVFLAMTVAVRQICSFSNTVRAGRTLISSLLLLGIIGWLVVRGPNLVRALADLAEKVV